MADPEDAGYDTGLYPVAAIDPCWDVPGPESYDETYGE